MFGAGAEPPPQLYDAMPEQIKAAQRRERSEAAGTRAGTREQEHRKRSSPVSDLSLEEAMNFPSW